MVSIRLLTEQDVVPFQILRLRALQESPDAFAVTTDEFQHETLTEIAERLRPLVICRSVLMMKMRSLV
jgi:hypothetical protein